MHNASRSPHSEHSFKFQAGVCSVLAPISLFHRFVHPDGLHGHFRRIPLHYWIREDKQVRCGALFEPCLASVLLHHLCIRFGYDEGAWHSLRGALAVFILLSEESSICRASAILCRFLFILVRH